MSTLTIPQIEAYGACAPDVWDSVIEEDPWWFHITHANRRASIEEYGLLPSCDLEGWDSIGGGSLPGRRDCVYLGSRYFYRDAGCLVAPYLVDGDDKLVVAVDMRKIDRKRVVADEDAFGLFFTPAECRQVFDRFGLEWVEGRKEDEAGAWAESIRLGSQPGVVEFSIEYDRLAVLGGVGPDDLVIVGTGNPELPR